MIEAQIQATYASLNIPSAHGKPAVAPKERAQPVGDTSVSTPASPAATQSVAHATHVVAPTTLLAAQEARSTDQVRRDDDPRRPRQRSEQDGEDGKRAANQNERGVDGQQLTDAELAEVRKLQQIDREVRAHERAHRAAGAGLTGPAKYTYVTGPDGKQYAVAGEVSIDVGMASSATATVAKMEQVIRAAMAPGDPSAQDLAVAAKARQILNSIRQEAREERIEGISGSQGNDANAVNGLAADTYRADQAYRERGAENGQQFITDQAREGFSVSARDGFSFVV